MAFQPQITRRMSFERGRMEGNSEFDGIDGTSSTITYEEALDSVRFGKYHYVLTMVAGLINASDAVEVSAISFILPSAEKDLGLTSAEKGWLTSIIFLGMMIGGYAWGTFADAFGRRRCLMASLAVNSVFGVLSAFARSYFSLLVLRFLSGLGVGGSIPVIFAYFCEFLPSEKRGSFMVILASFWMVGSIFVAGLAWAIIPQDRVYFEYLGTPFNSWRMFMALAAVPSGLCVLGLLPLHESPRYLLSSGQPEDAKDVLLSIHDINIDQGASYLPLTFTLVDEASTLDLESASLPLERTTSNLSSRSQRTMAGSTRALFLEPIFHTTKLLIIVWAGLSFGYYGFTMWMPEYFNRRFGHQEGAMDIYMSTFLVAISQLPINVVSAYTVDFLGRRKTLARMWCSVSMLLSGAATACVPFMESQGAVVIMSCIFTGVSVAGWNSLDILSTELFPTEVRSTGFGVLAAIGRVASMLANNTFGYLVDVTPAIPILLTAFFLALGSIAALKLPESGKISL